MDAALFTKMLSDKNVLDLRKLGYQFPQADIKEFTELLKNGFKPISFPGLKLSRTSQESMALNTDPTPKVIIASSGMCEAGRIRHHLKHNLWIAENIILIAGYQSKGTLGRALLDGVKEVRLFGEDIAVNAEIAVLHGTSGHADQKLSLIHI